MQYKHFEDKPEHHRTESKKSISEKSHKKHSSNSAFDSKGTENQAQSLVQENEFLKSSLNKSNYQKEELRKVLVEYKEAVEKLKLKNSELELQLNDIKNVRVEISKIKSQLTKRDEKIEFLISRNQELESLITELKSSNTQSRKPGPKDSFPNLEIMISKIRSNSDFHKIFKSSVSCINSFYDSIDERDYDLVLNSMFKFAAELMNDKKRTLIREASPGLSEIQFSLNNSSNATINYNIPSHQIDEDLLTDEERIERLSLELKKAVDRSKEILLNKSSFSQQRLSFTNSYQKIIPDKKSVRMAEDTVLESRNISRTSDSKNKGKPRVPPKGSILKRSDF